jgi:hypothetical protein
MTDERKRRYENLVEATDENAKSKALDTAARYYVRMAGDVSAVPTGQLAELMERAETEGSLTAGEIADILDCPELEVNHSHEWSVGSE